MADPIRVRFAPSPTGSLHVGHAHTALFNWLFARHHGGTFILRIEDTDEVRSTEESVSAIYEGLRWLGLDWDEGPDIGGPHAPYIQSERLDVYEEHYRKLLESGRAYYCYCSPEELEERREIMRARGLPPRYDNRCRSLSDAQRAAFEAEGRKPAVRFRMKDHGSTVIRDLIRGDMPYDNSLIGDLIIRKTSGFPTYHFSVVVDDHLMDVTHVIRGEDHISNTVPHLQLMEAFGFEPPRHAHLGLLMGPDRTKLSSRHGATDLAAYRRMGMLPQTMANFLALLGWSTGDDEEILSIGGIVERFDLDRVSKAPSVFDFGKCEFINGQHIRLASLEQLLDIAVPMLAEAGLLEATPSADDRVWVGRVIDLMRDRMRTVGVLTDWGRYFFTDEYEFEERAREKWLRKPETADTLDALAEALEALPDWTVEAIEGAVRNVAEQRGIGGGKAIHPCRAAVTGTTVGPSLFHLLELLPHATVVGRLRLVAEMCRAGAFDEPGPTLGE
ncbi:MAG: glutamate--tRNA ligase [Armatimonadetes bacterium]|nr:glutamate--tRNA ligase [Armatimonadota bacterium]